MSVQVQGIGSIGQNPGHISVTSECLGHLKASSAALEAGRKK